MVKQRQKQTIERAPTLSEFPGATSPMHWFENYDAENSRAWLVVDPPDGKVPPLTPEAQAACGARARRARSGRGPADSCEDRSLYDRCITRGMPGSMMPAIYGNSYQIHQGPGYVAITLRDGPRDAHHPARRRGRTSARSIRSYMGDARGHWEGNTLVVETTNFTDKTPYRGSSEHLKLIERFTPVGAGHGRVVGDLRRSAHVGAAVDVRDEPDEGDDAQRPFEYACHEGNYGLQNILSAARAEEAGATAAAK